METTKHIQTKNSSPSQTNGNENLLTGSSFFHSAHSLKRASQRGLSERKIENVLEYGECYFKQGLIYYVMGENNLPNNIAAQDRDLLKNTIVIVSSETNTVLTCYRSNNPFKNIRIKSKRLSKN